MSREMNDSLMTEPDMWEEPEREHYCFSCGYRADNCVCDDELLDLRREDAMFDHPFGGAA